LLYSTEALCFVLSDVYFLYQRSCVDRTVRCPVLLTQDLEVTPQFLSESRVLPYPNIRGLENVGLLLVRRYTDHLRRDLTRIL
jgi:hypothetical protein